jgi:hypothetical protein
MTDKNMGWQCPKCLVVYAPSVKKCECSTLPKVSYSGFGTTTSGTGAGTTMCSGYISDSLNGICSKCGKPNWEHNNISYT